MHEKNVNKRPSLAQPVTLDLQLAELSNLNSVYFKSNKKEQI